MASPPSRLPPPIVERAPLQRPPLPDRFGRTRKVHTPSCIARQELPYESCHLRSPDYPAFGGGVWRAGVRRAEPARPVRAAGAAPAGAVNPSSSTSPALLGRAPKLEPERTIPGP